MKKCIFICLSFLIFACSFPLCACKHVKKPKISEQLEMEKTGGVVQPIINVFNTTTNKIERMPLESYVMGVVAGEIDSDFPSEAIKAQAVLARTFALYFVDNGTSKYEGADISTDIQEAQAYAPEKITDEIAQAVAETQGKVLALGGNFVPSWFHSNSGGKTATVEEGFGNENFEPEFVKMVSSPENADNSQNAIWNVWLSRSEILSAIKKMGKQVESVSKIAVGKTGPSGRALTLLFGKDEVTAPEFRRAVGTTKMKSTFITNISVDSSGATFSGKGYGHGVGLSQWGAKVLAEDGNDYIDILKHYFAKIDIVDLY